MIVAHVTGKNRVAEKPFIRGEIRRSKIKDVKTAMPIPAEIGKYNDFGTGIRPYHDIIVRVTITPEPIIKPLNGR
jgi:hypothetical protein